MKMMNPKSSSILTIFTLIVVFLCANFELGFCREFGIVSLKNFGAIRDLKSSSEIESIARFAVEEHNKQENTLLRFGRVLKAKEQVVAGKIYHLTLEAIDAGKKTVYEAKVWVKPWMNFKQLQEFKRSMDIPHFRIADLRIARDGLGWHKVPIHDPEVQDAANHAVKAIQQRSNCLFPYKLLEIVQAETEVLKDFVKYNLLLKLRSGTKEEKLNVKLHKTANGSFFLNLIEHFDY